MMAGPSAGSAGTQTSTPTGVSTLRGGDEILQDMRKTWDIQQDLIAKMTAAFNRHDLRGTGSIDIEDVRELMRDLGIEPGAGPWMLD